MDIRVALRLRGAATAVLLAGWLPAMANGAGSSRPPVDTHVAEAVLCVKRIPQAYGRAQFDISRDGQSIVYAVTEPTPAGDGYNVSLWTGPTGQPEHRRLLAKLAVSPTPAARPSPRFSPDAGTIAYQGDDGSIVLADARGVEKPRSLKTERFPMRFDWSPDGRTLAVLLAAAAAPEPVQAMETAVTWPFGDQGEGSSVAVVDVATGTTRLVTDATLDATGYSWAPDNTRLAIAAAPVAAVDRFFNQDLYIADLSSGQVRQVAALDGVDSDPAWSPDGQHIAFATQAGKGSKDWLQALGLYDVDSGAISFPGRAVFAQGPATPRDFVWSSGGRLLFTALHRLGSQIFELDVRANAVRPLSRERTFVSGLAVAGQTGALMFSQESVSEPGDLYLSVDSAKPRHPRAITRLNPTLALPKPVMSILQWPSRDGRFTLEGVLLRPRDTAGPLPLITLIEGGPSMVRLEYELGLQYPVHALVAAGYAVFVPNTRGRGGYGDAFRRSIAAEHDYVGGGFQDLMAGVDRVIADGTADRKRLGIAGFSYGAVLTAYTVTHTHRFQAASLNDAGFDLWSFATKYAANPEFRRFWDDMVGYSDPYDPASAQRMRSQSPLLSAWQTRTPTLMEAGVESAGGMEQSVLALFQAFRHFDVPAQFVRYPRTGHGIQEPRLRLESARRNLSWFDRWLSKDISVLRRSDRHDANKPLPAD